jgi:hypothetical protein
MICQDRLGTDARMRQMAFLSSGVLAPQDASATGCSYLPGQTIVASATSAVQCVVYAANTSSEITFVVGEGRKPTAQPCFVNPASFSEAFGPEPVLGI